MCRSRPQPGGELDQKYPGSITEGALVINVNALAGRGERKVLVSEPATGSAASRATVWSCSSPMLLQTLRR
jgi:hypothetical protein